MDDEAGREPIVLGRQLAEASDVEATRLASGVGPSPLPEGKYELERGDYDLVTVASLPIDTELQTLTKRFRSWEPQERKDVRLRISMDEQYALIHFAKRSAVLALNEGPRDHCESGLTALSMIDETRIDRRDAAWAAGLLSYAVSKIEGERKPLFDEAIARSTPGMVGILERSRQSADLAGWGYAEVRTHHGLGLMKAGGARYAPTLNLAELALKVADWLNRGRYVAATEIAVEMPAIWFPKEGRDAAQSELARARAAVAISGTLRATYSHDAHAQMFFQWIVEMPTARAAEDLVNNIGVGTRLDGQFSVGVSTGPLFALLAAGSFIKGVEPFESMESLAELAAQTRMLLAEATGGRQ